MVAVFKQGIKDIIWYEHTYWCWSLRWLGAGYWGKWCCGGMTSTSPSGNEGGTLVGCIRRNLGGLDDLNELDLATCDVFGRPPVVVSITSLNFRFSPRTIVWKNHHTWMIKEKKGVGSLDKLLGTKTKKSKAILKEPLANFFINNRIIYCNYRDLQYFCWGYTSRQS